MIRAGFAALLALYAMGAVAQERVPSQPVFRYVHDAKIVCGTVQARHDGVLPSGTYGTTVNVFNPHPSSVRIDLALALAHPPGQLTGGEVITMDPLTVPGERALAIDCRTIAAMNFPYGQPTALIEGLLSADALQPLVVTEVWSTATPGHHGADQLTSLDVETISPRLVEVQPPDSDWGDGTDGEGLCTTLGRTSAIVSGTVTAQSYSFDEAPDEGPREVTRLDDVAVHAGAGGVVGGPIDIRLRRGFFEDGRFLDISEMPVLTVGERYVILLPNHGWLIEPVSLDDVLRIETIGARSVLVDQEGFGVTDASGGRTADRISTGERLFRSPDLTGDPIPDAVLTPAAFLAAVTGAALDCEGPVLSGPYTAFPLVPADTRGTE